MVTVRRLSRAEALRRLDEIATLRISVFRAFPYLYDGDEAYERRYLETGLASPGAVVIGALDDGRLVGAATASPLADHFDDFARPFAERGWDPGDFFYFGESVLLPEYRGRGVGVAFFDERERAAKEAGFGKTVFCAVDRPAAHPDRPAGYQPLDGFWRKRGYRPVDGLVTHFAWRDIGDAAETEKPMNFWMKQLQG